MTHRAVTGRITYSNEGMRHLVWGVSVLTGMSVGIMITLAFNAHARPPIDIEIPEEQPVVIEETIVWTKERIVQEIDTVALEYGVSATVMHEVIRCESSYNRYAVGDNGKSRGLVQIHSDYHDVSDEQAFDPAFAIRFLAEKLQRGLGRLWTCYRLMGTT